MCVRSTRLAILLLCFPVLSSLGCASSRSAATSGSAPSGRYCHPNQACWPAEADWRALSSRLEGALVQPRSPLEPCRSDFGSAGCRAALEKLKNPYAIQDDPGATESLGWLDAWDTAPSAYAIAAANERDVAAAVDFAHEHRIRLVIKGTGHDYLGRSSAPDSLLVWTHAMRNITAHESFIPAGCPASRAPVYALTLGAGTRWLEAYRAATKVHRYVQGGGCNSVGAAGGFLQGGGYGSWSNKFGIAAAGMLEARIVTADGQLRIANACQNADLFWALRGGGGGTFGVVTEVTLLTHPAPTSLGYILGEIEATSDEAFADFLRRFFAFYRESLMNEDWGEHVTVRSNKLEVSVSFVGMTGDEAKSRWAPFLRALEQEPDRFTLALRFFVTPGEEIWTEAFERKWKEGIETDPRPGQTDPLIWWKSNQGEVATYWYTYQSRWIPASLFEAKAIDTLARTLFDASRHWSVELYFSKGQASASADALQRGRETSVNPVVFRSGALAIIAATGSGAREVPGHEPSRTEGQLQREAVTRSMAVVRKATPHSGSYVNEGDYFEADWRESFWGESYPRLLEIKRKYDPSGVFSCHHCVGSDEP